MAGIAVEVVGISKLTKAFNKLSGLNTQALLTNVEAAIDRDLVKRFQTGTDPEGTPWLPSQRAIDDGGNTLLVRGNLRDSFHKNRVITQTQLLYGSDEDYAAIHQFGGKNGRGRKNTVVARPMIGLGPRQLRIINNAVDDFMEVLMP